MPPSNVVSLTPTFVTTGFGKPFAVAGFGNWFRDRCNEAGLPKGISAHGLRKATARRLADVGCTAHQIAAVTGHATLAEVQRYTKAADRKRLAREAMKKLIEGDSEHQLTNLTDRFVKLATNQLKSKEHKMRMVGPGEVSGFNRTKDLLSGEGQIAPLIGNTSPARFPHLGPAPR
jgi:hypothetical protein